jgi:hypothetical protein
VRELKLIVDIDVIVDDIDRVLVDDFCSLYRAQPGHCGAAGMGLRDLDGKRDALGIEIVAVMPFYALAQRQPDGLEVLGFPRERKAWPVIAREV